MGLIARLKQMFNKNIECGDEINGHYIYLYPSSNRIVNVNSHIIVGDDYNAVFVCNDKVCDVVPSGKHKISGAVLPKSFSKMKLDKPNKHGNYPKKFKADVYFIYKHIISQHEFSSDNKFVLRSNEFGKIKGYSEGFCDVQITEPDKLLKVLLIDRFFVPNKQGMPLVMGIVGNEVNNMIENSKIDFTQIILNPSILNAHLNPEINKYVSELGIRIYNLELTSFKLNKKVQKKVAMFLSERKLLTEEFDKTGIKYTPEQIVPNKVDISKTSADAFAPSLTTSQSNVQNVQTQNDNVPPQIIRRGGLNNIKPDATLNTSQNTEYKAPINSSEVFNESDKKVCKFCGETIDAKFSFCPLCGFKQ